MEVQLVSTGSREFASGSFRAVYGTFITCRQSSVNYLCAASPQNHVLGASTSSLNFKEKPLTRFTRRRSLASNARNLRLGNASFKFPGVLVVQQYSSDSETGSGRGNDQPSLRVNAVGANSASEPTPSASSSPTSTQKKPGPFARIFSVPKSVWKSIVSPLNNFGFGSTSIWEGGVGLFVVSGVVLIAASLTWVKGAQLRSRSRKYEVTAEFSRAQGITVGTPVRIRGVEVGNVVAVKPSLERIDVVVELADTSIVVPRNALVEVNQSGLISETLIDITPRLPIPKPTVGPLDEGCQEEGVILCDRERIKGEQGVSLDELVFICTKLARQVGDLGLDNMYGLAEKVSAAIEEAKPLLAKVEELAGDIEPLLKEIKEGSLLKDLERLTKVAGEAGEDLRVLNKQVLTSENVELLRQSVTTLTKTLSHIENISQDVSGVTGDAGTRKHLRQLIESLSRLVMD
ncbi:hypothetical protein R1sor_024366 [Riccia sorocarpa]|uniref:Mce/MlaD domain-containing protein n=1 Tax=Riccia sorocarpa TaxID=122646 RepID=A0ABD3GTI9_9MARC